MEQFVNKYLCRGGLILSLSFSNGEHEGKRVRYQQRNFDGLHSKLKMHTFHYVRNIRQTAVISILKLKIIRHNHEKDEKL